MLPFLTKAAVVLCFSAIFVSTGFSSTTGSVGLTTGLSGEPSGEYAVTAIPKGSVHKTIHDVHISFRKIQKKIELLLGSWRVNKTTTTLTTTRSKIT